MFEAPSASTNQPPIIGGITSRSARAKAPSAFADLDDTLTVTATVSDAETPADQLRYEWTADAGAVRRHRPRGHVAGARAGHHPGRGAPEPRRRRDLPDGERPGPAGHGGTPGARRVHGAAPRVGQGSARPRGRVPGRLLAAAALARAGRPRLHATPAAARAPSSRTSAGTSRSSRSRATASSRTRRSTSPSAASAAIATASATPAPTSRCAGNRRASPNGRRVVSFGDRPGERVYENSRWRLCDSDFFGTTTVNGERTLRAVQEVAAGQRTKIPDDHRAQRPRPLPRRRVRGRPRRGDLPRSDLHLDAGPGDHARPGADEARDELRLQRLRRGLRGVRGAVGVVGRARRHAARADPHRLLVVHLHHRDGLRLELHQHARDPVPLRGRRGGRVAERGENVLALDPRARARTRPGRLLRRRLPGRRPDAGPRRRCSSRGSAGAASSSASAWSASSGPPPGTAGSATSPPSTRPSAPPSSP